MRLTLIIILLLPIIAFNQNVPAALRNKDQVEHVEGKGVVRRHAFILHHQHDNVEDNDTHDQVFKMP